MRFRYLLLAASASCGAQSAYAHRMELKTELIAQQTPSWCWAATASMALQMLRFPDINEVKNYQCGVVAAAFPKCDDDCTQCNVPLDTMTSFVGLLDRYRDMAVPGNAIGLQASFSPNYVAYPEFDRIRRSIDLSYPVIAGFSPDGKPKDPARPEHAILITGYEVSYVRKGGPWLILRDPYPYARGEGPYVRGGYTFDRGTGRALVSWYSLRDRLNLSSAVFLEKLSARAPA